MAIKKSFRQLTRKEHQIENHIKPKAREELIKNHFEAQGFKVVKLEYTNFGENGKFLGMCLNLDEFKKLKHYKKIYRDMWNLDVIKRSLPDFICEKGKRIIFVEVKSESFDPNNSNHNFRQKETIFELRKKGYEVEVWGVDIEGMLKNLDRLESKPFFTKWKTRP